MNALTLNKKYAILNEKYEITNNVSEEKSFKKHEDEEEILFSNMSNKDLPVLMDTTHLPGPLSMKKLSKFGAFDRLSIRSGFAHSTAQSLEGRCDVLKKLLPYGSVACMFTASWIWLGGKIPNVFEIISNSHYRVRPHDHTLQVFRRKILKIEQKVIKDLHVTSPARTICDIALTPSKNIYEEMRRVDTVCALAQKYNTSFKECEKIIDNNPYFPGSFKAKNWIIENIEQKDIFDEKRYFYEKGHF